MAETQGSRLTAVTQEDHIRPEYSLHLGVDLYVGNIPSSNDRWIRRAMVCNMQKKKKVENWEGIDRHIKSL